MKFGFWVPIIWNALAGIYLFSVPPSMCFYRIAYGLLGVPPRKNFSVSDETGVVLLLFVGRAILQLLIMYSMEMDRDKKKSRSPGIINKGKMRRIFEKRCKTLYVWTIFLNVGLFYIELIGGVNREVAGFILPFLVFMVLPFLVFSVLDVSIFGFGSSWLVARFHLGGKSKEDVVGLKI